MVLPFSDPGLKPSFLFKTLLLLSGFIITASLQAKHVDPGEYYQHVKELMEEARIPGVSLAVIHDGRFSFAISEGKVNQDSQSVVSDDTVFEAASLSKPVLAFITLKMIARGQLSLGEKLYKHLPNERLDNQTFAKQLTPLLILTHQSGLPNWGGTPLKFTSKPGEGFGYSGEGYLYLQRVLEKISGKDLQTLAEEEVFIPLGMKNSYFTWSEKQQIGRADGHDKVGNPVKRPIPEANGASSLHTTAKDFARFMLAWLNHQHMPTPEMEFPFTWLVQLQGDEQGAKLPMPEADLLGWALGWGIQSSFDQKYSDYLAWHWGDNGVFRAFVAMNPKTQSGVVYLTNSENGLAIAKRMVEPIVGDMSNTFHWLNYGQSDSEGWQTMQRGYEAQGVGDYPLALRHFKAVLAQFPDNERLANRIKWIQEYQAFSRQNVSLTSTEKKALVGVFGPRIISLEGNKLFYQRQGNPPHELKPLTANLFAVGDLFDFRIEIARDGNGKSTRLIGHYIDGWKDESPRTN